MALVLPPQLAVVVMAIPIVAANLWQFALADHSVAVVKRFWPVFISILIGVLLGAKILSGIDEQTLFVIVGVAVIGFALVQVSSFRFQFSESMVKPAGVLFGACAGVIGGLSSFLGPLLVVYLISLPRMNKDQFVSSISFLYVSGVVPWAITLYLLGMLYGEVLVLSVFATAPVAVGLLLGQRVRKYISEQHFKILIVSILMVSGASMLWRAYQF